MRVKTGRRETCTYCLQSIPRAECTSDHVIAESWYAATVGEMAKWQVPACRPCNNDLGKIEREVLTRLAMCLDEGNEAYEQIIARAKRAMDPRQGKNAKDARSRAALLRKIKAELLEIANFHAEGVLPFFEQNFDAGVRHATPIPVESIEAVAQKWTRGMYRLHFKQMLPAHTQFEVHFLRNEAEWEVFGELLQIAVPLDRGPDLQVLLSRGRDAAHEAVIASFRIWQEFKVHCVATVENAKPAA